MKNSETKIDPRVPSDSVEVKVFLNQQKLKACYMRKVLYRSDLKSLIIFSKNSKNKFRIEQT